MSSPDQTSSTKDLSNMEWMYKGPAHLINREDYLLGRTIDKSLKILDEAEKGSSSTFNYLDEVEKDLTPMSIFAARPAGPVDVIRKIKEDPLFQIQKKEEESLKQLLKNPVKMKALRDMAAKGQTTHEKPEGSRNKGHRVKDQGRKRRYSSSSSDSSNDEDIDKLLAQKLSSRSMKDLKSQLVKKGKYESNESSSSDSERTKSHRHGHKPESQSSSYRASHRSSGHGSNSSKRYDDYSVDSSRDYKQKFRDDRDRHSRYSSSSASTSHKYKSRHEHKKDLHEEEKERRMKEMLENAKWRDQQRTKNVSKFREEQRKEEEKLKTVHEPDFIRKQLVEAAATGSIEKRIKSNSYNIQRTKSAINQNFARR